MFSWEERFGAKDGQIEEKKVDRDTEDEKKNFVERILKQVWINQQVLVRLAWTPLVLAWMTLSEC